MNDPLTAVTTRNTPQSQPIAGTVPNSAGGYVFPVDDWTRLRRFLILGTSGGSYYSTERELTRENADALFRCIAVDGLRTVAEIVAVSTDGRAPKQQPTMFALAACAGADDVATRQAALAALPQVCRTGTHLFLFAGYVEQFRGWGRSLRNAIGGWYTSKEPDTLAYQLAKYQQRGGWSHRDLLRLSKPRPERGGQIDVALRWAVGKANGEAPGLLRAVDELASASPERIVELIVEHDLPWEVVPSDALARPEVWRALLPSLGVGALVRNLGRMTANGALAPMAGEVVAVTERLRDAGEVRKSRIHPMNVLNALATYATGSGDRGSLTWQPIPQVVDALNDAFRLAFVNVEPAGKRTMLALDVSGSMTMGTVSGSRLTPRDASAAMALITLATEPAVMTVAFSGGMIPLGLSASQRLDDVIRTISGLPFDRTDCALPMLYALHNRLEVDTFVVYTDSETWAGNVHPVQALRQYRDTTGIPARLVVVGMVSNGFTIADPDDAGMLDVVGFDSAAPAVLANFSAGRF